MKKKLLCILMLIVFFMTGCGSKSKEQLKSDFINEINNMSKYYMEGTLSITNNDDNYNYSVAVSYLKDDYYRVSLKNQSNNYEQVIIKNNEGVYVVNPSLNRSFKFKSDWPYNSSQSYLLKSLSDDLKNDSEYSVEQKEDSYVFITKTNYVNNHDLVSQKITVDKEMNLKQVDVMDEKGISHIVFKVKKIDQKIVFADNYFSIDTLVNTKKDEKENKDKTNEELTKGNENSRSDDNSNENSNNNVEEERSTSTISEELFPLYIPANTNLSDREVIKTTAGQRIIMTFSGDNPFILVQENVMKEDELVVTPSYGEPYLLVDTVGALTDNSYTWISNGVEYYIVSDVLAQDELLEVARSINVIATIAEK